MNRTSLLSVVALLSATSLASAAFVNGQLAVTRVGAGDLGFAGTTNQALYIDFYDASTGALVSSTPIPGVVLPSTQNIDDGHISLSSTGNAITLAGYVAAVGTTGSVASSAVQRAAVAVSSSGAVNTVALHAGAYGGVTITAAVSPDDASFWTVGGNSASNPANGGLQYVSSTGVATNVSRTQSGAAADSFRNARLLNGTLYINTPSQTSFTNRGTYTMTIDGGLPYPHTVSGSPVATASVATPVIRNLEGSNIDAAGNPDSGSDTTGKYYPKSDCIFLDLNDDGVFDTAYGTGGKLDISKFSLIAGQWIRTDLLLLPSGEVNALDVIDNGSSVTLFVSTDAAIFKYTETATLVTEIPADRYINHTLSTASPFISATPNTAFRGIAIVPEPTSALLLLPTLSLLTRRRK